jgi:hypothetical protein
MQMAVLNGQTSSFLQALVSILSLLLVSEPYFNEPGYESLGYTGQHCFVNRTRR